MHKLKVTLENPSYSPPTFLNAHLLVACTSVEGCMSEGKKADKVIPLHGISWKNIEY